MPKRELPSPEYLRQRLRYDPDTGKLYWRYWEPNGPRWNSQWADKEAFTAQRDGYRIGWLRNKGLLAHRAAWAIFHGAWPEGVLDHRDKNRSNNRIKNLRASSRTGNARNQYRCRLNTSGVTGVILHKGTQKWVARIGVNSQRIYLGLFDRLEDAAAARKAAELEYGFDPTHGEPRP